MHPETRLFVGNLPENVEQLDLVKAFSDFGEVTNIDLKENLVPRRNFAFVTLSAKDLNVELCLKHFSSRDFKGNKIYVSRARESFLERLQKERLEANVNAKSKAVLPNQNPVINLGDKLNPRKRRTETVEQKNVKKGNKLHTTSLQSSKPQQNITVQDQKALKKLEAEKKRLESLKKKRQEFYEKRHIIKQSFGELDNTRNKLIKFSDIEDEPKVKGHDAQLSKNNEYKNKSKEEKKKKLFEEEDSGDEREFDFGIKKQFEGKKGQKVLDLQSSYKSDKRFTLDERFVDEEDTGHEAETEGSVAASAEAVDIGQEDEKLKQLNILQDVLGVSIKNHCNEQSTRKTKSKLGMLRFDPTQPEHTKFLAPVDVPTEPQKKAKKKKNKEKQDIEQAPESVPQEVPKVEVSKEQFYKVSENLKEAIAQPTTFSLRSLFNRNENYEEDNIEVNNEEQDYIPLSKSEKRKNPLDPTERNPFVYDSSESEEEENEGNDETNLHEPEKAVWRHTLFFTEHDQRLKEGLEFFKRTSDNEVQKERRELKSLMKKRIYNRERKNQMFKKKIGGKRKSMKKSFRRKT